METRADILNYIARTLRCRSAKVLLLVLWANTAVGQYSGGPGSGGAFDCIPAMIVLPVEILWMEVSCDKGIPQLNWATASELNSSHFVIERSLDAEHWERAGQVSGAGNSQQVTEYAWRDERPLYVAVVYYRLRQVDMDGHEELLAVMPLGVCGDETTNLVALPNPTAGSVDLRWSPTGDRTSSTELMVVDMYGRTLRTESVRAGAIHTVLDMAPFVPGSYSLILRQTTGRLLGRVHVVRY